MVSVCSCFVNVAQISLTARTYWQFGFTLLPVVVPKSLGNRFLFDGNRGCFIAVRTLRVFQGTFVLSKTDFNGSRKNSFFSSAAYIVTLSGEIKFWMPWPDVDVISLLNPKTWDCMSFVNVTSCNARFTVLPCLLLLRLCDLSVWTLPFHWESGLYLLLFNKKGFQILCLATAALLTLIIKKYTKTIRVLYLCSFMWQDVYSV